MKSSLSNAAWPKKVLSAFIPTFLITVIGQHVLAENSHLITKDSQSVPAIFIETIEIQGNTLLSTKELDQLVAHLRNGKQTLKELTDVAAAIQQAYRAAGYGGVVAFVPEQELQKGNIIFRVLEGKIVNIHITDNNRYGKKNILTSLPHLQIEHTPSVKNIDRNVLQANENPAKEIKVVLAAGRQQGEIDANVSIKEKRPLRLMMGFDTAGTAGTGNFRTNVGVQHANLWNRDHIGTFQFQTSPSHPDKVQVYSVGYRLPLYSIFSAVDLFYAHSNVDNVSAATPVGVGPLGFTGKGDVAGIRAHHYLTRIGEYDHRLNFGWNWRHFNNRCTVAGNLGSAGCNQASNAEVTIAPINLGYTGQSLGPKLFWGFNSTISGNLGGSSNDRFNIVRQNAEKHYFVWRLFAFSNLNLPKGFGLAARVSAQYSPHALVPGEQFGIGGGGSAMGGFISVRGYREREVVGDFGSFFNIEGLGPNIAKYLNLEKMKYINLRPLIFFDFGWAGNHANDPCLRIKNKTSCTLAGVGGGIRLTVGKFFSSRLDVGHALMDGNQKSAGSNRIHLSVNIAY